MEEPGVWCLVSGVFMASLRKRGDAYYIDYRIGGKRVRKSAGTDLKKAEAILAEIQAQESERKLSHLTGPQRAAPLQSSFNDIRQYCAGLFAPNTQAKYNSVLNNFHRFLTKRFSYIQTLNDINSDVLDAYREERRKEEAAPKTIKAELIILSKFFDLFVNWKYLSGNPVKAVDKPVIPQKGIPRILSDQEAKRLLDLAPDWLRPALFTFLNTGLRKHELENLEWDDVDLIRRLIHVRHKDEWAAKEQDRDIPINDALLKVLLEQKHRSQEKREKLHDSQLVFPDEHGLKYHHNRLRRHLIRLARKAGCPDVTQLHILRHTFAARLIARGVDLNTLRELLGHNDIKTTMIYAHLTSTKKEDAVKGLEF
jgi:site-specific recombinase XerD